MNNLTITKPVVQTNEFLFVFAVIARCVFLYYQPLKDTDYELVHIAADNLISGNGLSYPRSFLNDLSAIYYDPMRYWPPLTALLVAGVKTITHHVTATDLILMFTGMTGILLLLRKIMTALELSPFYQIIAWLFIIANPLPFSDLGLSDVYGTLFGLWSVSICLNYLQSNDQQNKIPIVAALIFFLPAAFRYQYYPVIFSFPLFLLIAGKVLHRPKLIKTGFLTFVFVLLLLGLQYVILSAYSNSFVYALDKKGFFPLNLVFMYPLLIRSFINSSYFENKLNNAFTWFQLPYLVFNLMILVLVYVWLSRYFFHAFTRIKKKITNAVEKKIAAQEFLFFVVGSAVIFTLVAASVIYISRSGKFGGWTYVGQGRYYMIPALLLLLITIKALQLRFNNSTFLKAVVFLALTYNMALWCKFIYNIATDNLSKKEMRNIADRTSILNKVKALQKNGLPVIVSYTEPYFAFFSAKNQYAITKKVSILIDSGYKTSAPVQLLIITEQNPTLKETTFLERNQAKEIFTGDLCRVFYILVDKNASSR